MQQQYADWTCCSSSRDRNRKNKVPGSIVTQLRSTPQTFRDGQTGPVGSDFFRPQLRCMGLPPELAQQDPCHSASDHGPNGGRRACPRHQVTQHLPRDNHNECNHGASGMRPATTAADAQFRTLFIAPSRTQNVVPLCRRKGERLLDLASPTTWPTGSLKLETRFEQDRFRLRGVGAVPGLSEMRVPSRRASRRPCTPEAPRSPPSNGA